MNDENINIDEQLNILEETKVQIKQAIIDKGQSVSSDDSFRSYATKIGNIEVLNTQSKTVTPTTSQQLIEPDQQYNALSSVTVNAVTSAIDNNIQTGNIKSGATILGVSGKFSVVDTSDANALADDIINDKTAYVNGQKVTGTLEIADAVSINNSDNTDTNLMLMDVGDIPSVVVGADINDLYGVKEVVEDGVGLEIIAPQSQFVDFIGLTTDKIKLGETILGVVGSVVELNGDTETVTPTTSQQIITPTSPKNGFTQVTVNPVTSAIDNNIQAQNIKDGVEILGVTGTLQGGTYQSKSLEITQNNSTNQIIPDTGYDALSVVEIEVNVDAVMTNSDYNTALDLADDILGEEPPTPVQAVIYGIKRLLSSTSPTWIRTDDSENMIANATIGGIEGTNDFDTAEIYKDIITQNYNTTTKQVVAEYGDQNFTFSPSDNDIKVMTYIPEFWAKRWQDNEYEYIQITNQETTGFTHIPSRRIGRYTTGGSSSIPTIKSGQAPLVNITLPNLRTTARSINTDIALMDIWTWNILQILYLVEYASYNSQDKLGRGYVDSDSYSALASGGCDSLGMKSGCIANDEKHAVIYRGVENIFGNIYQWLDGINFVGRQGYVCTNYTQYASDTTTNYTQLGYICPSSNNYIRSLGYDSGNPLVMIPSAVGGNDTSGITDYYYGSNSGNRVSGVGGDWGHRSKAGSFYLDADVGSSKASSSMGGRFVQYDSTAI